MLPLNLKNCEQVGVIECWGAQATTHDALCFFSRPRARFLLSASLSRARRRVMLVPLVTDLRA